MKNRFIIALVAFFLCSTSTLIAKDFPSYQIYTSNGKPTDLDKIIKASAQKQFVFFGEYHNNPICHWLQFELLKELHIVFKKNLILGAEMFEADNQFILDEYLKNLISSSSFQDEVRLWPNYNTDYKPLVEYAKEQQIPFIATNIPRRYANMVYKKGLGSLAELSELAKSFMVPLNQFSLDSSVACYKELMVSMDGHGGINMATAQAIKDATMAYFIQKHSTPKSVFLHFNGAYHSNNYEGIVYYLKKSILAEKILTISTVEQTDISKLETGNEGLADYIVCVAESMTKTH